LFRVLTLLVAALLAGCGFQMQGAFDTPPGMERTYIDTVDRNSEFHREFRRQLLASGVELVDTPEEATAIFAITADITGQRVLSVSARNVPTEYEVFYTVEYSLVSGGQTLLALQDVTFTQDYTWDETLVLGKAREENLLRDAIVSDLVRTILKQISSL
jgi:LPS-assembly lipoprotein